MSAVVRRIESYTSSGFIRSSASSLSLQHAIQFNSIRDLHGARKTGSFANLKSRFRLPVYMVVRVVFGATV